MDETTGGGNTEKFKVGDRVAFYSAEIRRVAIVAKVIESELLILKPTVDLPCDAGGLLWNASPNQCRKLIKKPKQRVWISPADLEAKNTQVYLSYEKRESWAEFVQRSPKKST